MTDYLPPLEPWPMVEVLDTLLITARELLKPGGRLVYFLPTVTEESACQVHLDSLRLTHALTGIVMKTYRAFRA